MNYWLPCLSLLAIGSFVVIASEPTTVTKVPATLTISERSEVQLESPQPDGMNKKVVSEIYEDRVLSCSFNGETISATNTIDTGRATVKMVPVDERRSR